jgi:hypothetical protein
MINNTFKVPNPSITSGVNGVCQNYCVVREGVYEDMNMGIIRTHGFLYDSDIYKLQGEDMICITQRRSAFIVNRCFEEAKQINDYLEFWGKKPAFVEIRPTKFGYGAFSTMTLDKGVFVGLYSGMQRPVFRNRSNHYLQHVDHYVIDGENMLVANWTRFINHSISPSLRKEKQHASILFITDRIILPNEELTFSYGEEFWKELEPHKINK